MLVYNWAVMLRSQEKEILTSWLSWIFTAGEKTRPGRSRTRRRRIWLERAWRRGRACRRSGGGWCWSALFASPPSGSASSTSGRSASPSSPRLTVRALPFPLSRSCVFVAPWSLRLDLVVLGPVYAPGAVRINYCCMKFCLFSAPCWGELLISDLSGILLTQMLVWRICICAWLGNLVIWRE